MMWVKPDNDQYVDELLLVGEYVSAGVYRRLSSNCQIHMEDAGYLPAAPLGSDAVYVRAIYSAPNTEIGG